MDEVTLVIPTHNRHQYLRRLLDYYSDTRIQILIADSSKEVYSDGLMPHVQYFHFPDMGVIEKLDNIVKEIKTKYLFFCADDDFWVKESIIKCIEFMRNNQEYSSVQGKTVVFSQQEKEVKFLPGYLYASNIDLTQESSNRRVHSLMSIYVPLFYSMHRSSTIKDVMMDCARLKITNAILFELLFSLYAVIAGKNKTLDIFTYARDSESSPASNIDRRSLYDIETEGLYQQEYEAFRHALVGYLDKFNRDKVISSKEIDMALSVYLQHLAENKTTARGKFDYKFYLKKILPHTLIDFFYRKRHHLSVRKLQGKTANLKGYPISDDVAVASWVHILSIIQKHGI